MTIGPFRDEYRWLSNFWYSPMLLNGITFETNEHLYQSFKALGSDRFFEIAHASSPKEAKDLGQTLPLPENWIEERLRAMIVGTVLKYTQSIHLAVKLIATGDEEIVEVNHWCDNYWGVCNCRKCGGKIGENHLGKTIMEVRDLIKKMYG